MGRTRRPFCGRVFGSVLGDHAVALVSSTCNDEYASQINSLATVSGAVAQFWFGDMSWQNFSVADALSHQFSERLVANPLWREAEQGSSTPFDQSDRLLHLLFDMASGQQTTCFRMGHRYWEFNLDYLSYVEQAGNISAETRAAFAFERRWLMNSPGSGLMRGTICAPTSCDEADVLDLLPTYLAHQSRNNLPYPRPSSQVANVHELSAWWMLSLDFVIVGVDRCGTTATMKILAEHPEIGFADYGSDLFSQHRILPRKSTVELFNNQWAGYQKRPRFVGILSYVLQNRIASVIFSHLDRVRVTLILCDPLGRFEKKFFQEAMCHEDLAEAFRTGEALPVLRNLQGDCVGTSIRVALKHEHAYLFDEWAVGPSLRKLPYLIPDSRLSVIYQDFLRQDVALVFHMLTRKMGVSQDFPTGFRFYRYNSRRGHRTDLCRNVSLANLLKRRLRPEYSAIRDILRYVGYSAPPSLIWKRSRCDRPRELADAPACFESRCEDTAHQPVHRATDSTEYGNVQG